MKRKMIGIASLLLALILLFTGCASQKAAKRQLPQYRQLTSLIGLSPYEALDELGWQEEEVPQWYDQYLTPMEGEISGVPFTIRLQFGEKLNKIVYVAKFQDDLDLTVKNALKVAKGIGNSISKEPVYDNLGILDITEAELRWILQDKKVDDIAVYWDLNELPNKAQRKYMRKLRESGWYEMPGCFLALHLQRVYGKVYLYLEYGIMADPTNPYNWYMLPQNDYHFYIEEGVLPIKKRST